MQKITHKPSDEKVVLFPRHLSTPPKELDLPDYMERLYENMFDEPWAALEARVLARHPEYAIFKSINLEPELKPKKKWWQICKQ
jgi:hypothetical protein